MVLKVWCLVSDLKCFFRQVMFLLLCMKFRCGIGLMKVFGELKVFLVIRCDQNCFDILNMVLMFMVFLMLMLLLVDCGVQFSLYRLVWLVFVLFYGLEFLIVLDFWSLMIFIFRLGLSFLSRIVRVVFMMLVFISSMLIVL